MIFVSVKVEMVSYTAYKKKKNVYIWSYLIMRNLISVVFHASERYPIIF